MVSEERNDEIDKIVESVLAVRPELKDEIEKMADKVRQADNDYAVQSFRSFAQLTLKSPATPAKALEAVALMNRRIGFLLSPRFLLICIAAVLIGSAIFAFGLLTWFRF